MGETTAETVRRRFKVVAISDILIPVTQRSRVREMREPDEGRRINVG